MGWHSGFDLPGSLRARHRWREVGGPPKVRTDCVLRFSTLRSPETPSPYPEQVAYPEHRSRRGFEAEHIDETPQVFHHRRFEDCGRSLWVPVLGAHKTLVLGSSQSDDQLDHASLDRHRIELARRRSGGGAVLVSDEDVVWFDVIIDDDDPLWEPDIGRSFHWLGEVIQRAMQSLGVDAVMHRGPLERSDWSQRVCFAGLGPGELTVDRRKLVGISQRRTRATARFQVAILRRWSGTEHRELFDVPAEERGQADADLEMAATSIDRSPTEILDAVLDALSVH